MDAAILSIGDELFGDGAVDSNPPWLTDRLAARGVATVERRLVPDDRAAIARAVRELATRCDVLIMTGGLGPTPDDLTPEALRDVLAAAGEPERLIANSRGTAAGIAATLGRCLIFALPGPPAEMKGMFQEKVLAQIPQATDAEVLLVGRVHCFGLAESSAADRLGSILDRPDPPRVGITATESIVTARIEERATPDEAARLIEETVCGIEEKWRPYAFGRADETLPVVVGALLGRAGSTLSTAESCTGGLLGKMVVDAAGSSNYYLGGWVTYSDDLKRTCLDVPLETLRDHGAVSEAAARAMAQGALAASGADFGLAVTGVAGPGGGSQSKPVGTVYVGLGRRGADRATVEVRRFAFPGDRATVRDRAAKSALQMLRFTLLDLPSDTALIWETT